MTDALVFHADPSALDADVRLFLGRRDRLRADDVRALLPDSLDPAAFDQMLDAANPGDTGRYATTYTGGAPRRVVVGVLPEACSRHNPPSRAWAVPGLVKAAGGERLGIVIAVDDPAHAFATGIAVARALPLFSAASKRKERRFDVAFVGADGVDLARIQAAADAVRAAARLVDTPPDVLTTDGMVAEARAVAERTGADIRIFRGQELLDEGLGLIHAVGRASETPPAMIVLDHAPEGATGHTAWVGKGIVYDTGGLSIKTKTGMPGMKNDMGGAAAVLAAFEAAVRVGCERRITAVLCVAENAVGPKAVRPDDVLTGYSGRTVEVNNTDAEGRLVLADGLAWVVANRKPDEIVDIATLTGAQAMATGHRHAALYCSDEALEQRAVTAGRACGEPCHPLLFAPELFRAEFRSTVADMRNSVKDRRNAQASCAGQFLHNHLGGFEGPWLHVDMGSPGFSAGRGTGYGVGLLLTLVGAGA